MREIKQNKSVFLFLILLFIGYTYFVYTEGTENVNSPEMNESAIKGRILWQENNCTACHQIYGLGGYLGPDLTNVYRRYGDGTKGFFNAGKGVMTKYNFTDKEQEYLLEFLKSVDESGNFPNKNVIETWYGDVEIKGVDHE
jgi:nitric oxide reductase subunit C